MGNWSMAHMALVFMVALTMFTVLIKIVSEAIRKIQGKGCER